MTCQELVELVSDYLEGALSAADAARFDAHLADCRHCREYLEQLRVTVSVLGRLEPADVPQPVLDDLLAAFRGYHAQRS
jgi:predicted anti-sigma-YlaC factor YlaD